MTDVEGARELLAHIRDCFERRVLFQWGIARRTDDRIIGTCTLYHIDTDNRRAELGYALGREFWGNGYMQEALTALLEFSFGALNMHRLEADVDPRNVSSVRTLERLGFQKEGYLRERWLVGIMNGGAVRATRTLYAANKSLSPHAYFALQMLMLH